MTRLPASGNAPAIHQPDPGEGGAAGAAPDISSTTGDEEQH